MQGAVAHHAVGGRHQDGLKDPVPASQGAGGHPHTVFPTSYGELHRITNGTPADVGE